ncbi:MAG: TetR/AcrR family transcriptional regulator [Dehalococcoidia bacterium]|nr:TetR/AcrR family transcriptional regulator [Dehalococcoidia bacterium]
MSKKKNYRKEQILKTAAQLFAAKGYHAVTLDEIAHQLNIRKASLYYYIKSKEALLEEISDILLARSVGSLDKIPKSHVTPVNKLRQFIINQINTNTNSIDLTAIFYDQASSINKRFYSRYNKFKKRGEADLQLILQEGVEKGYFVIDDIKMASFLILSACNWIYKWYNPYGRLKPDEIASIYIKILENGLLSQQARRSGK